MNGVPLVVEKAPSEFFISGWHSLNPHPVRQYFFAYYDPQILGPYLTQEEYEGWLQRINAYANS